MRSAGIAFLVVLGFVAAGCVREAYREVDPVRFAPGAPAGVVFPVLVRHAAALGYVLDGVDPMRGVFAVHSRVLGRASPAWRRARGRMGSNVFVVQVRDGEVRVTAVGRHVAADGRMHPTLAEELAIFGDSLRRAALAIAQAMTSGGAIPAPPAAYVQPSHRAPPAHAPAEAGAYLHGPSPPAPAANDPSEGAVRPYGPAAAPASEAPHSSSASDAGAPPPPAAPPSGAPSPARRLGTP